MKINFTKKEYRLLLSMLEIAEWVMTSNDTGAEENPQTKPYKDVVQKLLSHSKEMGCQDWVEYAKDLNEYYPTREFEESEYRGFIDEYDEQNFWSTLPGKLANRDLFEQVSAVALSEMSQDERFMKLMEIEGHYEDEFDENGLKNLRLIGTKENQVH